MADRQQDEGSLPGSSSSGLFDLRDPISCRGSNTQQSVGKEPVWKCVLTITSLNKHKTTIFIEDFCWKVNIHNMYV